MSYTLNLPGQSSIVVQPGSVDTVSTSLALIGKNTPGYGQYIMQNFISLLSNSESTSPPANPVLGQTWWDSTNKLLKVWNGSTFKDITSVTSSITSLPPGFPVVGDLWWDTTQKQLKIYDGTNGWVVIGPSFTATQGKSGWFVESLYDDGGTQHVCVNLYISNVIYALINWDSPPWNPLPAIDGLAKITPGFNLKQGVNPSTLTVTNLGSSIVPLQNVFANYLSGQLTTAAQPSITSLGTLSALSVGGLSSIAASNTSTAPLSIQNAFAPQLTMRNTAATNPYKTLRISNLGNLDVMSNANTVIMTITDAGTLSAVNINTAGSITAGGAITSGGAFTAASISTPSLSTPVISSANGTVAVNSITIVNAGFTVTGDATLGTAGASPSKVNFNGYLNTDIIPNSDLGSQMGSNSKRFNNMFANAFVGTSVKANYADVAEIYDIDEGAFLGAILVIGGDKEVTISTRDHDPKVIGVISSNPALLMNDHDTAHGIPVALTGRVFVQVKGPISRGDCVVSSNEPGIGQALDPKKFIPGCVVGKALSEIDDDSVQSIEVVIGRL
jgi:hypothetical protein